jgi:hypothetical protein
MILGGRGVSSFLGFQGFLLVCARGASHRLIQIFNILIVCDSAWGPIFGFGG